MIRRLNRRRILFGILFVIPFFLLTGASIRFYDSGKSLYAKIQLFSNILKRIREEYVEEKDPQQLIEKAISGMVSSLDPHTTYLTEDRFKRWNQDYEGYSGIGITYDIIRNKITIMSVFANGPSDKVHLKSGDRIVAIDGESAIGMKRDEVPLKLMGSKGTKVEVGVERRGWSEPKKFVITRDEVHVKSVPYAFMIRPGVGYISIIRFSSTTGDELGKALQQLESRGMKQLILDLRDNAGGYLEAAVEVADKFLPQGKKIVYTQGRVRSSFREFFSTDRSTHTMMPLIVLINRVSASASEIVAGALQDWDRALILGETSFGKGLVQRQYKFNDGSALLMTTARYYTPSGRLIQRPYDEKSFEDYYTEISNDSLRKKWERDASRPSFKTQILGREVYGGGGITPNIFLTSQEDTLDQIVRKMLYSPHRLFFTFVEDYVKNHPEIKTDFNDFLRNYNPPSIMLQQFLSYIRELGFQIKNREFLLHKQDIRFILKLTIAAEIWGNEARYKVQMLRDHHLLEGLSYFPQAETLLARAYYYKKR